MGRDICSIFESYNDLISIGIAFPTTLNINHVICHYAPGPNDALVTLRKKDMVKIELGVHIDGFPAMVGHTLVVGATKEDPVTGKLADIMQAAHLASEGKTTRF